MYDEYRKGVDHMTIGKRIKDLRKELNMSVETLAEKIVKNSYWIFTCTKYVRVNF